MSQLELDKPIFQRSLEHYKLRLEGMKDDSDIKFPTIKDDIIRQINHVKNRINELDSIVKVDSLGEGDYRKDICLALSCYVEDLEESVKTTKSKINNLNLDFKNSNEEIELAKLASNRYCPNNWSPKS